MRKKLTILFLSGFFSMALLAQGDYGVGRIPLALLKNANVVKRFEHIDFEVMNPGEAILRKKYAVTILNENGDNQA
ncbi:MAG: hypothetical protein JNM19_13980, partial [Chitinophagaceae bacterium]|nr:hypothetical protein [Chitinophagaceae bacterium]